MRLQPRFPRPARATTLALFCLLVAACPGVPTGADADEAQAVCTAVQASGLLHGADEQAYWQPGIDGATLRVIGVEERDRQDALASWLSDERAKRSWRPIVLELYDAVRVEQQGDVTVRHRGEPQRRILIQ
jgi:hypothetical protein